MATIDTGWNDGRLSSPLIQLSTLIIVSIYIIFAMAQTFPPWHKPFRHGVNLSAMVRINVVQI
jgi:uncharacterized protein (UPF0371 family)